MNSVNIKPFIKWAGGKRQLLNDIRSKYPISLGKEITKYAEPFVGGGAVLFDVLQSYDLNEVYISDINRELILTYKCIQNNVCELIDLLKILENEYHNRTQDEQKKYYYAKRKRYNKLVSKKEESSEISALFIFLNKTCFNGLYRVNQKGLFNVPVGSYKQPLICDESNLLNVSKLLQNVIIKNSNYLESESFIDANTFVYFDPPYRPLTKTANFTAYNRSDFNDDKQVELANYIKKIDTKGAYILASNSDPKNQDETDTFMDDLYMDLRFKEWRQKEV